MSKTYGSVLSLFARHPMQYFSAEARKMIKDAIEDAESATSGEIRVFVEHYCPHDNPVERARLIFCKLQMDKTAERNAVLIYVAMRHHKLAVYADEGIYKKSSHAFWDKVIRHMEEHFKNDLFTDGIIYAVHAVGEALSDCCPYHSDAERNELPDDLVFGKTERSVNQPPYAKH